MGRASNRINHAHAAFIAASAPTIQLIVNNLLQRAQADPSSRLLSVGLGTVSTLLLMLGAWIAESHCRPGRLAMSAAPVFLGAALGFSALASPGPALLLMFGVLAFYAWLWRWVPDIESPKLTQPTDTRIAAASAGGAVVTIGFALAWSPGQPWLHWVPVTVSMLVAGAVSLTGRRVVRLAAPLPAILRRPLRLLAGASWLSSAAGMLLTDSPVHWCLLGVVPTLAVLFRAEVEGEDDSVSFTDSPLARSIAEDPARMLVTTFFGLGVGGGLLLWLPVSSTGGDVTLLDAVFTAFSASCVTGLAVVDTPTAWTGVGQVLILLLIQVGGLGIMAFPTVGLSLLGRRMSMKHEAAVAQLFSDEDRGRLVESLKGMLRLTFATEALGALALWPAFVAHDETGLGDALWKAVFTSVSAFCNAGFALDSDSLVPYAGAPWVLGVVGVLITVGGLGPAVVLGVVEWRQTRRLTAPVRLVLTASGVLVALPACLFVGLEWKSSRGGLPFVDRFTNALFQSVTLRTAGFNSVDFGLLRPVTLVVMMVPMLIGGSPGSTAGGVKTTAFALLVLYVIAVLRGRSRPVYAGFEIGQSSVNMRWPQWRWVC